MACLLETELFEFFAAPSQVDECSLDRRHDIMEEIEEIDLIGGDAPCQAGTWMPGEPWDAGEDTEEATVMYEPDTEDEAFEQRYEESWARYGHCGECRAKHTMDELVIGDLRRQVELLQQQLREMQPLLRENLALHAEVERLKRLPTAELVADRPKRACRRDSRLAD